MVESACHFYLITLVHKNQYDRIRNDIGESRGSTYCKKMVEARLRWFGHVERRSVDYVVRRVD